LAPLNLDRLSIFGDSNIGVYVFVNNRIALTPPRITRTVRRLLNEVLGVEVVETTIAGSSILGVFVAGNNKGLLLPSIITEEELDHLRQSLGGELRLRVVDSVYTAWGNLVAANDNVALASGDLGKRELEAIGEALGVEVHTARLVDTGAVGAVTVFNNKAGLIHPGVPDESIEELSRRLGVRLGPATVNEGVGFVKSGVLLNDQGVLVGHETTGPEIMNIMSILG